MSNLAHTRRSRLNENSHKPWSAIVRALAQARWARLSERIPLAWVMTSSLNETGAGMCFDSVLFYVLGVVSHDWFVYPFIVWSMMACMFCAMWWYNYMLCFAWNETWIFWLVVHWHETIMLETTCGMLLVKEFQGKLLVMVWLVYALI